MTKVPLVSIIIPCRNEERFIGQCLKTVFKQNYPKDKMEVLIVDGASQDQTREIVENWKSKIGNLRLLDNPKKYTPFGLNIGIKEAKGDIIIRMDAHAGYEKDYVQKCVKYLREFDADNVGGVVKTLPSNSSVSAKAVALCLSHPFGAASSFRIGCSYPREADTVFGGCYKREIFDKVGLFNENLIRSQDLEFNLRLKRSGGKIILHPDMVAFYYPKAKLWDFFYHNVKDGIWAVLPLKLAGLPFKIRHYLPLFFILTLPLGFLPYILASLFFSLRVALTEKDVRLFFIMPLAFAARHFGYGIGSLIGLFKLFMPYHGAEKTKGN